MGQDVNNGEETGTGKRERERKCTKWIAPFIYLSNIYCSFFVYVEEEDCRNYRTGKHIQ